ncbi:hypothetical protein ACFLY8_02285 [Halobacteriota archaeon]
MELKSNKEFTRADVEKATGASERLVSGVLNKMCEEGDVEKIGSGHNTKYVRMPERLS